MSNECLIEQGDIDFLINNVCVKTIGANVMKPGCKAFLSIETESQISAKIESLPDACKGEQIEFKWYKQDQLLAENSTRISFYNVDTGWISITLEIQQEGFETIEIQKQLHVSPRQKHQNDSTTLSALPDNAGKAIATSNSDGTPILSKGDLAHEEGNVSSISLTIEVDGILQQDADIQFRILTNGLQDADKTWTWDFGDGNDIIRQTGVSEHWYRKAGRYQVRACDDNGTCVDTVLSITEPVLITVGTDESKAGYAYDASLSNCGIEVSSARLKIRANRLVELKHFWIHANKEGNLNVLLLTTDRIEVGKISDYVLRGHRLINLNDMESFLEANTNYILLVEPANEQQFLLSSGDCDLVQHPTSELIIMESNNAIFDIKYQY